MILVNTDPHAEHRWFTVQRNSSLHVHQMLSTDGSQFRETAVYMFTNSLCVVDKDQKDLVNT